MEATNFLTREVTINFSNPEAVPEGQLFLDKSHLVSRFPRQFSSPV
jgi:hypothetical protein